MADDSTAATPTPDHLAILRHALGEPQHADACQPERVTRNFYFADAQDAVCADLANLGLMEACDRVFDGRYYKVTPAGFDAVRRTLPRWRAWDVTTTLGSRVVYAATRSKARAQVVYTIMDAWSLSWAEAAREITSVRGL